MGRPKQDWRKFSLRSLKRLPLLFSKEWRELTVSRAYWLLLLAVGPLVGHGFINAVNLYAEASGVGGGPAALPQGLTPLDGMLAPTFGAYDLAVTLLFPFVAIRLIAAEKESGALKLGLQLPFGVGEMVAAKLLALVAGWIVAWLPGLIAVAMWRAYGGHLYAPETLNLLLGHWLRMLLSAGVAIAAAALAESAAIAAIVTLVFTIGTWALDFIAAGRGGWLATLAAYSPDRGAAFFRARAAAIERRICNVRDGAGRSRNRGDLVAYGAQARRAAAAHGRSAGPHRGRRLDRIAFARELGRE